MELSEALKAGVFSKATNPIEIILTAYKEDLTEILNKQIEKHYLIMRNCKDPEVARKKFKLVSDFNELELKNMVDLKSWNLDINIPNTSCGDRDIMSWCQAKDNEISLRTSVSILKSLRRKKIYKPIDDSNVIQCYNCKGQFSLFLRKHHCRSCGRIFCYSCSQWYEYIPKDLINYIDTGSWIVEGQSSRVCQGCKVNIDCFRRIEEIVKYFEIMAYPFDLCVRASTLSKDWREAMRIYLSNLCDMQYSLPSSKLLDRDIRALKSNREYIQGHSKWMLQALKLGKFTITDLKIRDCHEMMCDRNCTDRLTPFDAIIILNTGVYNSEVRLLAINILKDFFIISDSDIDDNKSETSTIDLISDIALFLPLEEAMVQDFILKSPTLFINFFWLSRVNQSDNADIFRNKLLLANQYQATRVQEAIHLISLLDKYPNIIELSQKLQTLKVPFTGPFGPIHKFDHNVIIKHSATSPIIIKYYVNKIRKAFMYKQEDIRKDAHVVSLIRIMYYLCSDIFVTSKSDSFLVSSDPINISLSSDDISSWFNKDSPLSFSPKIISNKNSFSQDLPLSDANIISEHYNYDDKVESFDNQTAPISEYENDNYHCDDVYKIKETIPSFLATYRVLPISSKSGFIEIIQNARTLSEILSKGSISNYLYRSNIDKKVSEISSNYTASLAFWTVTTFLLGVGDRHLDNIMIRNDGVLFHIDYGFIFEADSTLNNSYNVMGSGAFYSSGTYVRLDYNLIEGLGGIDMYEPFKLRCCEIYCCLRRHFNLICSCLLRLSSIQPPIEGHKFTSDYIEKFVTERFLLGYTEEEARGSFSKIIDSSRETLINRVSDAIHSTVSTIKNNWW